MKKVIIILLVFCAVLFGAYVNGDLSIENNLIWKGKADAANGTISDDDCTGEQGWFWYDSTDSAFEFCNANSGAPTVLGGGVLPGIPTAISYWEDDFPCKDMEDGEFGTLGWMRIGTATSGSECNYQQRIDPGWSKIAPGGANTIFGVTLGKSSTLVAQTFGGMNGLNLEDDTSFVAYFGFNSQDLTESIVAVGLGDGDAQTSLNHAAGTRDFVGAYFKNETTDSASECYGTTGTSANWQALVQDDANTSGLQDLTEAASSSITTMTWVRIDVPATGQIRVCVDVVTSGAPAFVNCYTETTATRISDNGMAPMFAAMTCDGTSGGNDARVDIAYFGAQATRW